MELPALSQNKNLLPALMKMVALVLASAVFVTACAADQGVPPLEQRAHELNKAIMCPVCPGESIDQSQNPLAVQMRAIVSEKLGQGVTEGDIKEFFVERYGPSVLLEPPTQGFSLVVWVIPPIVVVGAILALCLVLRSMRRPRTAGPEVSSDSVRLTQEERARYFQRIETTLEGDGITSAHMADQEGPSIEVKEEQVDG